MTTANVDGSGERMAWLVCEHTITKESQRFSIRKPLTTIGRARGNDLTLADPQMAKTHASLMRSGQVYTLTPNTRTDPLYLNGKRVRSASLREGDIVLLGAWQITFSLSNPSVTDDTSTPEAIGLDLLASLVELGADMMRDTKPERLFNTLLKGLLALTGSEKGFLIVLQDGERLLAASHNLENRKLDMTRVSDSIIDQVVRSREGLIVSDALQDTRFGKAQSVVDLKLSSVMCVPLMYRNDLLGVLYLGNDSITNLFTQRDLQVLKLYAAQASLILHHALMLNQLRLANRNLRNRLKAAFQGEMIGNCAAMKAVFKVLRRVAPTDLSVLVLGETGTGKELVARELHKLSTRSKGPFIAINCGAIPENLLESELFGHRKGSFTGAVADKMGKVEAAAGGTLFLDEIGEMPMNLQVKLLRVLQERSIERVGDLKPRSVDIRVISATNKDLQQLIGSGAFREDLFYRLNEISVQLPPLRDRGEDIVVLAQFFLKEFSEQYEAKAHGFNNKALVAMRSYFWPGNVRELRSRIKKALIMSDRALINAVDLEITAADTQDMAPLAEAQEAFKLEYIRKALDMNNWNKAQTARQLDVDARTVFRYIEKFKEAE